MSRTMVLLATQPAGMVTREAADLYLNSVARAVERQSDERRTYVVEIIDDPGAIQERVARAVAEVGVKVVLILGSASLLPAAKKIKADFKDRLGVVVLTGAAPDDVVIMPKRAFMGDAVPAILDELNR